MDLKTIKPDKSISLFVKNILVLDEREKNKKTVLPFFADGYPGFMFQETENGLFVSPHNKKMPLLFLYGQTIKPIELHMQGSYQLIIFQLYPFVLKSFFNVTAKDVNDDCYDLQQLPNMANRIRQLLQVKKMEKRIENMTDLLFELFQEKKETLDLTIRQAILLILDKQGQISNLQLCQHIHITERTLERRFLSQVGISPKQFSQIIRFQQSFEQLTSKDFSNLTEIVYNNGFADQSHFIRVFKAFTGKTPKEFTIKKS